MLKQYRVYDELAVSYILDWAPTPEADVQQCYSLFIVEIGNDMSSKSHLESL